jgi:hypothetical protein
MTDYLTDYFLTDYFLTDYFLTDYFLIELSRWNTKNSPNFYMHGRSRVHGYFVT